MEFVKCEVCKGMYSERVHDNAVIWISCCAVEMGEDKHASGFQTKAFGLCYRCEMRLMVNIKAYVEAQICD